jgi:hypothetical protein
MERMHSFDNEKHEERLESMEIERFLLASESQSEVTGVFTMTILISGSTHTKVFPRTPRKISTVV